MRGKILGGGLVAVVGSVLHFAYRGDLAMVALYAICFAVVVAYTNRKLSGGC